MTSPVATPAFAAGPLGSTTSTVAPGIPLVDVVVCTPSHPTGGPELVALDELAWSLEPPASAAAPSATAAPATVATSVRPTVRGLIDATAERIAAGQPATLAASARQAASSGATSSANVRRCRRGRGSRGGGAGSSGGELLRVFAHSAQTLHLRGGGVRFIHPLA